MLNVGGWILDVPRVLYFDHNATHPLSPTARRVWLDAVEKFPANPSSPHRLGQRAEKALEEARERLAGMLGCRAEEIAFTSGATESANMALAGEAEVVASAIEHPCVREALGPRGRWLGVSGEGVVQVGELEQALKLRPPALVAVMAANNETGVLQPWRDVLEICQRHHVPYFCDAAQWIGKMPARGLGACDLLSGCAHKFGGPVGVGFLKCPRDWQPLLKGGPQEHGRRAGTENVASILAMVAALEEAEIRLGEVEHLMGIRAGFEGELLGTLPGARVLGAGVARLWNTVSVVLPETPECRRRWVVVMDKLGFAVSTGSACASGKEKASHVLTAMGLEPGEAARVLRFSAGWETTAEDWKQLLEGIKAAMPEMTR
jgi:cysteine desulfurase